MAYSDPGKYCLIIVPMQTLSAQFASIQERIHKTELKNKRKHGSVQLLAVSKKQPVETLKAAHKLGQRDFAENYLQDAIPKILALQHLPIKWHFIGHIQSNKTRQVAENFDWVHSIDRIKIAQRLNDQRPAELKPVNVCLQVLLDDQPGKSGVSSDNIRELALSVTKLPKLRLRGLMALPKPTTDTLQQRETYRKTRHLQQTLANDTNLELDTLSMGMSSDFEAAIAEGATIIRIGTALFGPRENNI